MTLLQSGIELFNDGEFFRCHEVLEEAWTPERGPLRLFLQSLIHIAAAFHHHQRGNYAGAVAQLRKGLRKLEAYLPSCEGIDTGRLFRESRAALESIEVHAEGWDYPLIHLHEGRRAQAKPPAPPATPLKSSDDDWHKKDS